MNNIDESHFHPDSVGKSNVRIQHLKRTKSRGSAVTGKLFMYSCYEFQKLCNHSCCWLTISNMWLGTDAMATKDTQRP